MASNAGISGITGAYDSRHVARFAHWCDLHRHGNGRAQPGFTASGTGNIDDADVTLPAGSTITYTVHATIGSSAVGTLSNTATLNSAPW